MVFKREIKEYLKLHKLLGKKLKSCHFKMTGLLGKYLNILKKTSEKNKTREKFSLTICYKILISFEKDIVNNVKIKQYFDFFEFMFKFSLKQIFYHNYLLKSL